jgi:UDP-N-acetylmuramoyl-tripeptide--D-alanyl-D-alanine ligase
MILNILSFFLFVKLFLFWLWLWQLKEYHVGRFLAHFESQKVKKIISSFWRLKYPVFTSKMIVLFACGLALFPFLPAWFLIILAPVFTSALVLFFQLPTLAFKNFIIAKAKKKRRKFKNLLVVGITGSYGKTSTKEFLAEILSEKYKVLKTSEHQNSEMGIVRCILGDLRAEHEVFVAEMGAYNKGGIKLLASIVKPKIGVITGVNEQHLATFGSMENLLSAEGGKELIERLPKDGSVFFNAKNEYCLKIYEQTEGIKKFLYGQESKFAGGENVLGAIAVAKFLGLSQEEISRAVEKIGNKFPGIEIKKGINGSTVIDATYSANPTGLLAHLEYLRGQGGQKIIIMPCLIELGRASERIHREIGNKIGEVCDLAIITTKDRFKEIQEGAGVKAVLIEKPDEILQKVSGLVKAGDIILLESRLPKQLTANLLA